MTAITADEARTILRALTVPTVTLADAADTFGIPTAALESFATRHGWPDRDAIAARINKPNTPKPAPPKEPPIAPAPNLAVVPRDTGRRDLDDLANRARTPRAQRLADKALAAYADLADQVHADEEHTRYAAELERLEKAAAAIRARMGHKKPAGAKKQLGTRTALIRAWARDNGIDVPTRGVLPDRVLHAYNQAHPDET